MPIMLIKLKGISQNMLNILNIRFFIKAIPLATTSRLEGVINYERPTKWVCPEILCIKSSGEQMANHNL